MRYVWVGVCAAVVLAAGIWQSRAGQQPGLRAAKGGAALKHGEYLVSRVGLCGDCHTPRDAKGRPDLARALQGAPLTFQPKEKVEGWADHSPDITGGGLAGKWTEAQVVKFLTTGLDPDGKKAAPPMPAYRLEEGDARAVALYLKSLPGKKGTGRKGDGGRRPD
jgi:mono/diheme cytochrome c family protein